MRHNHDVFSAQFSADGLRIVTASVDRTARVWDATSGKSLGEPLRHDARVDSAQFSPDGTRILTVSGSFACIWDAPSGRPLGEILRPGGTALSAGFSTDGSRIVTKNDKAITRVWDSTSGTVVSESIPEEQIVSGRWLSPNEKLRVDVNGDRTSAQVSEKNTDNAVGEPLQGDSEMSGAEFSADGRYILTREEIGAAVWDVATSRRLGERLQHEGFVSSAEFSPNGKRIVTAGYDKTVRLWDVASIATSPVPVPDWLLARARAIAGLELNDGKLREMPAEQRHAVLLLLQQPPGNDEWAKLARWITQSANERTLTPDSKFTCRQIAERERDSGFKEGIESALRYDPTVPLAHVLLAKFEENPQRADFLRGYGLKLLPEDAGLWSRAAASLVEQKDFARALKAADKALSLDPKNADTQKARAAAMAGVKQAEKVH